MKAAGPTSRLFSGHYRSDYAQILSYLGGFYCINLALWRSAAELSDLHASIRCRIPLLIYRRLSVQKRPCCGRQNFLLHKSYTANVSTLFQLHIESDAAKLYQSASTSELRTLKTTKNRKNCTLISRQWLNNKFRNFIISLLCLY